VASTLTCHRCGERKPGLDNAPLPGKWGSRVQADICADCWHDWIEEQTRLINHERLLPAEPEHRKILYARMAAFLNLTPESV
jgi:Fe-S cluster biosynthesis and repair protein YggX